MSNTGNMYNNNKYNKKHSKYSFVSLVFMLFFLNTNLAIANESIVQLQKAPIDLSDNASLQRGAKYYMNFCAGCHSMDYMRYSRLAKDLKITDYEDSTGEVLTDVVKANLMFSTADINSHIKSGLIKKDADEMFGVAPPDLTMVTRVRGEDWVYSYLKSFYTDPKKRWGVNNLVFKDVAMPNILENYQGKQVLIDGKLISDNTSKPLVKPGDFDQMVTDLTAFMSYAAEPYKSMRVSLGIWVLLFLSVLLVFACLLKREFWKDIKK